MTDTMTVSITNELGEHWSRITVDMFHSIIIENLDGIHDRWDILPEIVKAIAGNPTEYGAEFEERVQDAMAFTLDDGRGVFDSDYDAV